MMNKMFNVTLPKPYGYSKGNLSMKYITNKSLLFRYINFGYVLVEVFLLLLEPNLQMRLQLVWVVLFGRTSD